LPRLDSNLIKAQINLDLRSPKFILDSNRNSKMLQLSRLSFIYIILCLLFFFSSFVQANELVFEPAKPTIETFDEITLTVSGTSGEVVWQALKGEIQGSGPQITYVAPRQPDSEVITVTDAVGNTSTLTFEIEGFFKLHWQQVLFLFIVGVIGGLLSGFVGASGAFILTPAMMSLGVPAIIAVASHMCHKFPPALTSAIKRTKNGLVDIKLAIIMGLSAEAGVFCGALIQIYVKNTYGNLGSNFYVSLIFVVTLAIVGGYALREAWKISQAESIVDEKSKLLTKPAQKIQSIRIPGTMMYFPSIGTKISILFIFPIGFVTGLLAVTIGVAGFVAVPGMMYLLGATGLMASATQLVVAFVIGIGGTIQYALEGFVDIRLAMILLAGSFFGIQLGNISTLYVKDYMIKMVLGVVMILVLLGFLFKIPIYLSDIGYFGRLSQDTLNVLELSSFAILVLAFVSGAIIIFYAHLRGYLKYRKAEKMAVEEEMLEGPGESVLVADENYPSLKTQLSPTGRFEKMMLVSDGSYFSSGAIREAIRLAQRTGSHLLVMSVIKSNSEHESLAKELIEKEKHDVIAYLETIRTQAIEVGLDCDITIRYGMQIDQEIVDEAEQNQIDVIVMGRRGYTGLMRVMMGSSTAKVIGYAHCSVLIVPRTAQIGDTATNNLHNHNDEKANFYQKPENNRAYYFPPRSLERHKFLVAVDGSRYSDIAANAAINIAKHFHASILVVSIVYSANQERRHTKLVEVIKRIEAFVSQEGIPVEGKVLSGKPAEAIMEIAKAKGIDLIILGSHGRTGLDKILLGSVSDRVIGYTNCPVLVVK